MSNLVVNKNKLIARFTGRAGEHAVAAQIMLRGMAVLWPSLDIGYDLMADNGCRVQVKTAHVSLTEKMRGHHGEGAYVFPLPRTKRIPITDSKVVLKARPKFAEICDVVAFWGVEGNRFWVVPSLLCDKVQAFVLGVTGRKQFSGSIEALREMEKLGYTRKEIAAEFGCSTTVVGFLMNSDRSFQDPSGVSLARACENAWEHILDFSRSPSAASEQPQPISVPVVEET